MPILIGGNGGCVTSDTPEHRPDGLEDTKRFDPSDIVGSAPDASEQNDASLFETYERRPVSEIIAQQRAYRESQAAQAARTILQDAEIPEFEAFEANTAEYEDFETDQHGRPRLRRLRVQHTTMLGRLMSPGAQIVYVLLIVATLGGMLALAFSTDSPVLLLVGGIATPMLLPLCVWRWFRWLDSAPYYYRLLTSLGEDARNLLEYRLLWKKTIR